MHRPGVFMLSGLFAVMGVSGCQKPDEQLDHAEKSIQSWYATLTLAQTQWTHQLLPAVYLKQLADAADKSLDEQAQTLRKAEGADASRKAQLSDRIAFVRDRGHQLHAAADHAEGRP